MSQAKAFFQKILTIDGVTGCAMVKQDGTPIGHCVADEARYWQLLHASCQAIQGMATLAAFKGLRSLRFRLSPGEACHLIPIGGYVLAVASKENGRSANLVAEVMQRVEMMKKTGAVEKQGRTR